MRRGVAVDGIDDTAGELVRDHGLLQQASDDHEDGRPGQHGPGVARGAQLWNQLVGTHDRARDKVGEERLEDRHLGERRGGRHAPVDVDDVRDRLEREERDADREDDLHEREWRAEADRLERGVHLGHEEAEVLEDGQQPEVERHRRDQRPLARGL
jgi:hypothetical protein